MPLAFFLQDANGTIRFSTRSKRHPNKTLEEVALCDPRYLRWARREHTVGHDFVLEAIDQTMTKLGVPFSEPRHRTKKKS